MNAQPVVTAKAAGRARKAPQRAAPAASLAGMRLWKEPAQDAGADSLKPGCLARLCDAETRAQAAPGTIESPSGDIPAPVMPSRDSVPVSPTGAAEGQGVPEGGSSSAVAIAEGGLEPHVSPYPQRARSPERRDSDILGYWARIRGEERHMPAWRDLDQNQIAYFWPNSFLLECKSRGHGSRPIILKATRIVDDDGMADRAEDIAFTPPMVSWILGVGVDVIEVESPLDGHHSFRSEDGARETFDIIAMPLSADDEQIDHVLCHVKRR